MTLLKSNMVEGRQLSLRISKIKFRVERISAAMVICTICKVWCFIILFYEIKAVTDSYKLEYHICCHVELRLLISWVWCEAGVCTIAGVVSSTGGSSSEESGDVAEEVDLARSQGEVWWVVRVDVVVIGHCQAHPHVSWWRGLLTGVTITIIALDTIPSPPSLAHALVMLSVRSKLYIKPKNI